jgi:hypothetical protein
MDYGDWELVLFWYFKRRLAGIRANQIQYDFWQIVGKFSQKMQYFGTYKSNMDINKLPKLYAGIKKFADIRF